MIVIMIITLQVQSTQTICPQGTTVGCQESPFLDDDDDDGEDDDDDDGDDDGRKADDDDDDYNDEKDDDDSNEDNGDEDDDDCCHFEKSRPVCRPLPQATTTF